MIDQGNESTKFSWQIAAWQRTHRDHFRVYCHSFVLYCMNSVRNAACFYMHPSSTAIVRIFEIQLFFIHPKSSYTVQTQTHSRISQYQKSCHLQLAYCNGEILMFRNKSTHTKIITVFSLISLNKFTIIPHLKKNISKP